MAINDATMQLLVTRFLQWQLPPTVCSDLCVTDREYKFLRSGINLLNAPEAEQMLKHVLSAMDVPIDPDIAVAREFLAEWSPEIRKQSIIDGDWDTMSMFNIILRAVKYGR